uniref:Uncharacterized protein n=1 Tax=Lutzomyia longipalpis TaxID=7200 RepID=A0A7G3B780_LUTLO
MISLIFSLFMLHSKFFFIISHFDFFVHFTKNWNDFFIIFFLFYSLYALSPTKFINYLHRIIFFCLKKCLMAQFLNSLVGKTFFLGCMCVDFAFWKGFPFLLTWRGKW